jgi:hypothetical protein
MTLDLFHTLLRDAQVLLIATLAERSDPTHEKPPETDQEEKWKPRHQCCHEPGRRFLHLLRERYDRNEQADEEGRDFHDGILPEDDPGHVLATSITFLTT